MAKKKKGCLIAAIIIIVLLIFMGWFGSTEVVNWSNAAHDNNVIAYQEYIKSFPQGSHVSVANARIDSLKQMSDSIESTSGEIVFDANNKSIAELTQDSLTNEQELLTETLRIPDDSAIFVILVDHQKMDYQKAYNMISKVPHGIITTFGPRLLEFPSGSLWIEAANVFAKYDSRFNKVLKKEWYSKGGGRLCDVNYCWENVEWIYSRGYGSSYHEYRCKSHKKVAH